MSEPEEVEEAKDCTCTCGHALSDHWPDENQHHACDECGCEGFVAEHPA